MLRQPHRRAHSQSDVDSRPVKPIRWRPVAFALLAAFTWSGARDPGVPMNAPSPSEALTDVLAARGLAASADDVT
jgi:hypothetical protein